MQDKQQANFAPIGMFGFGMTLILLSLANIGLYPINSMLGAMGFAFGGMANLIAGFLAFRQENTFGGTSFCGYGLCWISFAFIASNFFDMELANGYAMGSYMLVWGLFSLVFFVVSLKYNPITKICFGLATLTFFALCIANFIDSDAITIVGGAIGLLTGIGAFYSAAGQLINAEYDKKILPLF